MDHGSMNHDSMNHEAMGHDGGLGKAGFGSNAPVVHKESEKGFQVDMQADNPTGQLNDPGIGLRGNGRRVLTYGDLRSWHPTADPREPEREVQLHLTGNMSRYMWSMDGIRFADAEPLMLKLNERVRITLVNDTMMNHPIHLHGMWSDLEDANGNFLTRRHTIPVQPAQRVSFSVTADALGRWAWHCHLLLHMDAGMFREVIVA